ncbi:MAG TPA: RHS repeat-associated core domain-containing protein [Longimicrobium sp.]|nr:RHS repeat-associated core domain-containing protein [Longimicrobium sp.]
MNRLGKPPRSATTASTCSPSPCRGATGGWRPRTTSTTTSPRRATSHTIFNGSTAPFRYPGEWIRDESLQHDLRGKLTFSGNGYGLGDSSSISYSALGHLASSTHTHRGYLLDTDQDAQHQQAEAPSHDALGNIYRMDRSSDLQVFERRWLDGSFSRSDWGQTLWRYEPGTARLLLRQDASMKDSTQYDAAGNIVFSSQQPASSGPAFDRASFYDADGRLRVAETRRLDDVAARSTPYYMVFEEHRYDALGRRVWVRTRKDCKDAGTHLGHCAVGTLRRIVWDGDAELYEIAVPVSSDNTLVNIFFSTQEMESDTATVRGLGRWDGFDPHPQWGRVAYTYGHAIDKPISVIRMNYADHAAGESYYPWPEPFAIVPHWNLRGNAQTGTYANGARHRCLDAQGTRCVALDWAEGWFPYNPARPIPEHWHGSLLTEKRDGSGLLYRRNRYYDPSTSRFTQEDPIGLAGGLNLYGFAAGDPVTYSDPYGLRPEDVIVACRAVDGTRGLGGHCAVRVVNEKLNIDVTYELLANGIGQPQFVGQTSPEQAARYEGRGVQVAVPNGMTSDEFDLRVLATAERISQERNGRPYSPSGTRNSNRFVYDVITQSGGKVPWAAVPYNKATPGICGGRGIFLGNDCSGSRSEGSSGPRKQ